MLEIVNRSHARISPGCIVAALGRRSANEAINTDAIHQIEEILTEHARSGRIKKLEPGIFSRRLKGRKTLERISLDEMVGTTLNELHAGAVIKTLRTRANLPMVAAAHSLSDKVTNYSTMERRPGITLRKLAAVLAALGYRIVFERMN